MDKSGTIFFQKKKKIIFFIFHFFSCSLHTGLMIGFLILSTWAWNVICAPEVFAWYFGYTALNMGQLLYILYQMRPIQFDDDLESIYEELFAPMNVSRAEFKKLVGGTRGKAPNNGSQFLVST